jgi:peroxiredoxin
VQYWRFQADEGAKKAGWKARPTPTWYAATIPAAQHRSVAVCDAMTARPINLARQEPFMLQVSTRGFLSLLVSIAISAAAQAQSETAGDFESDEADVLAGHSYHGEVFNEGPRQQAYLMEGTGTVHFPVTTQNPLVQQFVDQGVGQLHGFWYFEAERSFRQAAMLDPQCAISYWGMAMANIDNASRGKGFIAEAVQRKAGVSPREAMYIDALDAYFKADEKDKKARAEKYTKALERILYEYPEDLEAKAILALQLWKNRDAGIPIASYLAVDALLDQIFAVEPLHPAHHYRIHLWDYERAQQALSSAAVCGQAAPAIAHMWHMPGHIYSRLKRYEDAAWQQEASARVDHAHMIRDRVLPDQIHNFAHNNEWLIRDLSNIGRVRDAIDLAKNMTELPRHPQYNTLSKKGSAYYGRLRLFELLSRYELWEEMIALCQSPYLEPTDLEDEQIKRLRYLGQAYFQAGDSENGRAQLAELQQRLETINSARTAAAAEAETQAKAAGKNDKQIEQAKLTASRPFDSKVRTLEKATNELLGHQAVARGDYQTALSLLAKNTSDKLYVARVRSLAGETEKAVQDVRAEVKAHQSEVHPLACLIDLLWRGEKKQEAAEAFQQLREISASIDLKSPVFTRLGPIAQELGFPEDWRLIKPPPSDVGSRPPLDSLGPFRWHPSAAPDWMLKDAEGNLHSLKQYQGKPVVVIFYLGSGCLHCVEQIRKFAPLAKVFESAGLSLVAISSEDQPALKQSLETYDDGPIPIPLLANAELDVFKSYRAYDDFEKQPLHATLVIDAQGLVRWQDINYEPFMDADFVLQEADRLLAQPLNHPLTTATPPPNTRPEQPSPAL